MIFHHNNHIDDITMSMLVGICNTNQPYMLHDHTIRVFTPRWPNLHIMTFELGHNVNIY
jgi:hypothetical protein